jgi:hypothetical protein
VKIAMFRKQESASPPRVGSNFQLGCTCQNSSLPAFWPSLAHRYAGTKCHGIEPMAQAFAEAGFAALLHDHRGFGDSGGEPRHDIKPWQQITDWRRAISYLQDGPEVDENRVGLWGTRFASRHAIVLGRI